MSSDDGFRVGRRVREGDDEGEIVGIGGADLSGTRWWGIQFDRIPLGRIASRPEWSLELLPCKPATPEPDAVMDAMQRLSEIGAPDDIPRGNSRPDHYAHLRERGHEPWAVIAACMTRDEAIAYHRGTALVYLMRAGLKHATPDDDICKAAAHLAEAKAIIEGREAA